MQFPYISGTVFNPDWLPLDNTNVHKLWGENEALHSITCKLVTNEKAEFHTQSFQTVDIFAFGRSEASYSIAY